MKPAFPSSSPSSGDGGNASDLLEQAIAWVVRLGSGSADETTHSACDAWRAAHPAHEQAWQQVQAVEDAFRQVPRIGGSMSGDMSSDMGDAGGALAHGALQAAALMRAQQQRQQQSRRRALGVLGLAVTGGVVGLFVWRETPWEQRTNYATAVGERQRVTLADGTELNINTGSEVQVIFSPRQRRIVLSRGELFVRTGADSGALLGHRAFWVETPHARFEALGTRFGVREQDDQTRLSLTEGRVAIHTEGAPPVVAQAGDGYIVRGGAAQPQRIVDRSFEPDAWTDGALVARQMRLDAFVAELARYHGTPLLCDADVASLRVSGVFQLNGPDPVGRALEALVRTLPVRLEHGTGGTLTVARR
ncbi:FecR family protein [Variovorax sp. YR634]|uniref:FecR family protein n=1 Tax=Variovorax sp. YR634 TaxID=1884385 RepID=UPI000896CEB6|nr:FecR domain-containing protein [Variovorax sp. YR634]SDZ25777.1 FecR family protein [Variovorax sp. YR634]